MLALSRTLLCFVFTIHVTWALYSEPGCGTLDSLSYSHGFVSPGSSPWTVRLCKRRLTDPVRAMNCFCGGVLINRQWVLSAAHCLLHLARQDYLILVISGELFYPPHRYTHWAYGRATFNHDLVIIELDRDVPNSIPAVCLPEQNTTINMAVPWVVTGWRSPYEKQLRVSMEKPITLQECRQIQTSYPLYVSSTMRCTSNLDPNLKIHKGYSGGPLVAQREDRWELVGIVSWGVNNTVTAYTDVVSHLEFLTEWGVFMDYY